MAANKKDETAAGALPSIAKVKDDDKAKEIQDQVKADIGEREANPLAADSVDADTAKPKGKKYRIMDSVLEVKVGSIVPDPRSVRTKGTEVWSSEFEPKELEKRYLDAGAIEVWTDEPAK